MRPRDGIEVSGIDDNDWKGFSLKASNDQDGSWHAVFPIHLEFVHEGHKRVYL